MQATDLFLGLMTDKLSASQDSLPQKADSSHLYRETFQSMFEKAMNKPVSKADRNSLANQSRSSHQSFSNETPKVTALSAYRNQSVERTNANVSRETAEAAAEANTDASRNPAVQVVSTTCTDGGEDATNIDKKLEALIARIQQEIDEGTEQTDSRMVQLLLQLIAMMLQENAAGDTTEATGVSNDLKIALALDPDSKLSELFDMLLKGQDGLTEQDLKDVNILLKLTGEKGLLIPLSELVRQTGADQEGGSANITLQLTDQTDASKTVELKLTIDAADVKAAKLVDLSDPALKQSDLVMVVPLEKLASDAEAKADLRKMLDLLAQKSAWNELEAVQASGEKEVAAVVVEEQASEAKVVVPLKAAENTAKSETAQSETARNEAANPKVETADPMFLQSDKYLKAIQVESLAKEMLEAGADRKTIFDKLARLLLAGDPNAETLEKVLAAKNESSLSFTKDWTQGFSEQTKKDTSGWAADMANDIASQQKSGAAQDVVSSGRVAFIGRAEAANDLAQIINQPMPKSGTAEGQALRESVMSQIVQRASYVFQNGAQGEVRIFLRPENLGDLQMKVKIEQDVVTAKFTATSNEVKAIIENNLGQLKQALDQMGIKVGKFEVQVNTGSGQQQAQQGPQDAQGDSFGDGQSYSASDAAGTYGATLDLDYENAALYSPDGTLSNGLGRVSYFA